MKQKYKMFCPFVAICLVLATGFALQAKGGAKGELVGVVNINEASVAQLTMLPGVGQKRAEAIRNYAQAHPFKNADELKEIRGVGNAGLEKLKPYVVVTGLTTAKWVKEAKKAPAAAASNTASPVGQN